MNNLVSIIVPVYNIEKYINRCIDSIIKQSYKKIEVIIIDDGSTDNSSKIIDNYPQKDSRIKVIHKENGGLSSARNEGMKYASGDFLCFIDGDDYIESTMIEEMMSRSEGKDVIICGFYVDFEKANGKLKKEYKNTLSQEVNVECDDDIKQIEINENLLKTIGYAWNKLYRKQFLEKNNLIFELNLSRIEDTEFNCRVLRKTRKFLILNKAFNHYVQRNRETLGNKKYANQLELDLRLNKCHVELLENCNIPQEMIEKNQK